MVDRIVPWIWPTLTAIVTWGWTVVGPLGHAPLPL